MTCFHQISAPLGLVFCSATLPYAAMLHRWCPCLQNVVDRTAAVLGKSLPEIDTGILSNLKLQAEAGWYYFFFWGGEGKREEKG